METQTPILPQEAKTRTGQVMPKRYVIGIISLLVILVLGILTPDFLQYRTRRADIAANRAINLDSMILVTFTNSAGGGSHTNFPLFGGVNTNISLNFAGTLGAAVGIQVSLLRTNSTPSNAGPNPPQTFTPAMSVPNTNLFETYARLVTLLLSIISVLGLFFAYFVRKSLRETEEELEKRFENNMKSWADEQAKVAAQVKKDAEEIRAKVEKVKDLETKLNEAMDALDRADKQLAGRRSSGASDVEKASITLDGQITEPENPDVIQRVVKPESQSPDSPKK